MIIDTRQTLFCQVGRLFLITLHTENEKEISLDEINAEIAAYCLFFQLAPRIAKFSCRAESFCRVTKQPFSAIS